MLSFTEWRAPVATVSSGDNYQTTYNADQSEKSGDVAGEVVGSGHFSKWWWWW